MIETGASASTTGEELRLKLDIPQFAQVGVVTHVELGLSPLPFPLTNPSVMYRKPDGLPFASIVKFGLVDPPRAEEEVGVTVRVV
jgi:hypothetical protein